MRHGASYFPSFCVFVDKLQGSLYCGSARPSGFKHIRHHRERKPQEPIHREGCEPTILTFQQLKTKEAIDTVGKFTFYPHLRVIMFMPTEEICN